MKEQEKLARELFFSCREKTQEQGVKAAKDFVQRLGKNKKLSLLPGIFRELKLLIERKKAVIEISRALGENFLETIKNNKLVEALIRDKEVEIKIKEDLVGGFSVKTEDYLLDGSIKGFIQVVKQKYTK